MKKILIIVFAVLVNILFLSLPVVAQEGKLEASSAQDMLIKSEVETAASMLQAIYAKDAELKENGSAIELEQFVERGADLIAKKGEKAFGLFREKGSQWLQGDRYLFVWDMNGLRYVYPPNRKGEGENVRDIKDIDGKPIGELIINTASSKKGEGWLFYRWPKPDQSVPDWKSTYVMKAKSPSDKEFIIGSGAYDMPVQRSFVKNVVEAAVQLIEQRGVKAFDILRDRKSQYIYQDTYVFVIADYGVELLNVAFSKLEGKKVIDYKDTDGNYFVREFIDVAKNKGHGWVDYPWPKPGDVGKSQKSTYVRKAMIDGKMVVVCAGLYKD